MVRATLEAPKNMKKIIMPASTRPVTPTSLAACARPARSGGRLTTSRPCLPPSCLMGLAAALDLAAASLDPKTARTGASPETGEEGIDAIRGLARRQGAARLLAAAIALFLASLAGLPPLAGWPARSGLFHAVLATGSWTLVAGATVAGVVGWLGLVRVVAILLDRGAEDADVPAPDADAMLLVGVLVAAVIGLGLLPSGLAAFASRSVVFFGG